MFDCFDPDIIKFMLDIRFNNNKAYMHEHQEDYIRRMRTPFYEFIEAISPVMRDIDPGMELRPHKCLSRIYRDTRFTKDKSPYRDHHWVAFRHQAEPKEEAVVLWMELQIDTVHWGLGFWGENRKAMEILKRRIIAYPDELLSLLPDLEKRNLVLAGETARKVQVPENLDERLKPWYQKKEIFVTRAGFEPERAFKTGFFEEISADFMALKPFYRLLRGCYELGKAGEAI